MTYHLSVKTGGKGAAARHAKYIGRRGAFESKSEDLVDTFSGNLPGWTSGDTTKFWQTADKYERSCRIPDDHMVAYETDPAAPGTTASWPA